MQVNQNVILSGATNAATAAPSFATLGASDLQQLQSLLQSVAGTSGTQLSATDLEQLQSLLAQGGVTLEDPNALNILATGVANGALSAADLHSLISLVNGLSSLPTALQRTLGDQLLLKATEWLTAYQNNKSLSSDQVAAAGGLLSAINTAQSVQSSLDNLNALSAGTGFAVTPSPTPQLNFTFGVTTAVPYPLAPTFNIDAFTSSFSSGNLDPIMAAMMILFSYINNVQTPTLKAFENNYQGIQNQISAITSGQTGLLEVTQFMAANSSTMPVGGINLFAALDVLLNTTVDSTVVTQAQAYFYTQFNNSCGNFMTALTAAYNQYIVNNGGTVGVLPYPAPIEDLDQIAAGDSAYAPNTPPPPPPPYPQPPSGGYTAQAQIMTYFIQGANAAGYNISGMSSLPVYTDDWTNGTVSGVEGTDNTTLYVPGVPQATPSIPPSVVFGAQLTLTPTSVSQFIGSGGGGQSGSGALGMMSQTLTNGSTTSNTVQSEINAVTQAIAGIWTLIGQALIPNDKFTG